MLKSICRFVNINIKYSTKVGIIGVPFEKGQRKNGVSLAPKKLRDYGLISQLKEIEDIDIKDYGDIEINPNSIKPIYNENMIELAQVSECTRLLSEKITAIRNDDRVCVTLGGDHSIGIGTITGHHNFDENVIVLWVDAHADINTDKTSPSGNIHGMPVGVILKELRGYWSKFPMEWMEPRFSARNLAFVGLRAVDDYEKLILNKLHILSFGSEDVERFGIDNIIEMTLQQLDPQKSKKIHVSFDIDSLDVSEAPSTGTAVRGGLTLREGIYLMEKLNDTGRLAGVDLVEVNPSIGTEKDVEKTVEAAVLILKAALGYNRRGMAPKNVKEIPK